MHFVLVICVLFYISKERRRKRQQIVALFIVHVDKCIQPKSDENKYLTWDGVCVGVVPQHNKTRRSHSVQFRWWFGEGQMVDNRRDKWNKISEMTNCYETHTITLKSNSHRPRCRSVEIIHSKYRRMECIKFSNWSKLRWLHLSTSSLWHTWVSNIVNPFQS